MDDPRDKTPSVETGGEADGPGAASEFEGDSLAVNASDAELQRATDQLVSQRDLALALSVARDLDTVLSLCMKAAMQVSGLRCGGIYLVDEQRGGLVLRHAEGLSEPLLQSAAYFPEESARVQLVKAGLPIYRGLKPLLESHRAFVDAPERIKWIEVTHHAITHSAHFRSILNGFEFPLS